MLKKIITVMVIFLLVLMLLTSADYISDKNTEKLVQLIEAQ